jgi:hypothetical protein
VIDLPRALGISIETFDAWMLADEKALTSVLKFQVPQQSAPEEISNPKQICIELHNKSTNNSRLRDIYADLAAIMDIGLLESRCPKGFKPFASRVQGLRQPKQISAESV